MTQVLGSGEDSAQRELLLPRGIGSVASRAAPGPRALLALPGAGVGTVNSVCDAAEEGAAVLCHLPALLTDNSCILLGPCCSALGRPGVPVTRS